jgi:antibiotic biosynthesis monooxygenase (ABM) superfamily enzyme
MPPNPPAQIDWVILLRFESLETATSWLNSKERLDLIEHALPLLVGQDDIHILKDNAPGVLPAPVSAVIATRLKPGTEAAYRAWEKRSPLPRRKQKGFQGYRFEPPIPGVQESWLAIVRFDSDANLQVWMNSPVRLSLLKEAEPFTEEFHARIVRTGFDQWFGARAARPGGHAHQSHRRRHRGRTLCRMSARVFLICELAIGALANGAISNIAEERDDLPAKFCRAVDEVGDALAAARAPSSPRKRKCVP